MTIAAGRDRLARGLDAWLAGVVAGLVVLGPGLGPGSLLNLDLVLTDRIPVPPGTWGLGPPLPQRVPLGLPMAWLSTVVGGPAVGKALIVVSIAAATAGAARLAAGMPVIARLGAGLLYGAGPYAITRASVGHLHVLVVLAALPWAFPRLARPALDLRRTFLWAVLLAFGGATGGLVSTLVVLVGLAVTRTPWRRAAHAVLVVVVAQLLWLVPSVVAVLAGAEVISAGAFRTNLGGPLGWFRLVAGGGFWRPGNQIGGGIAQAALGALVLGLALAGRRGWPEAIRRQAELSALAGTLVALASATPGLQWMYDQLTARAVGAPLRDSGRASVLLLLWAAPAAAAGAVRVANAVSPRFAAPALATPAAIALVLAAPGLWGAGGGLEPVEFPAEWSAANATIESQPGTVLALPWHEYLDIDFAGGRRVLNPLPDYLAGDVISSYDPEIGPAHQEQLDARADGITEDVLDLVQGEDVAGRFAERGVRWVIVIHQVDWQAYQSLATDPGLELVQGGNSLDLYRVVDWPGRLVDATGREVRGNSPIAPVLRLHDSGAVSWYRAGSPGWVRGWRSVAVDDRGFLAVPPGNPVVWYPPALAVLGADAVVIVASALALASLRRRRIVAPKPQAR